MITMPTPNFDDLTKSELELARGIVSTRGANKGRLRASKPTVNRVATGNLDQYGRQEILPDDTGKTAYIWRHVAFYTSPIRAHNCIPTLDFCDLPARGDAMRELEKELQVIVDKIVGNIDLSDKHGLRRWLRAQ